MGEAIPVRHRARGPDRIGGVGSASRGGIRVRGRERRIVIPATSQDASIMIHNDALSGRVFSSVTHSVGPSTKWRYRFEAAAGGGTDLVESFETLDDDSKLLASVERHLMHITDRKAGLEAGRQRTLVRCKAVAEPSRASR